MTHRIEVTKERLVRLYVQEKRTIAECVEILGCSRGTVREMLRKYIIKILPRCHRMKTPIITKKQLETLYVRKGLSLRGCAEALGLPTAGGLSERLRKLGIKARPGRFQKGKKQEFHRKGENASSWKGGKKSIPCTYCGKQLEKFPSQINETNFCDMSCRGKWRAYDMAGKKVGMLSVIRLAGKDRYGRPLWECQCDCGKTKLVSTSNLGAVRSCGCGQGLKGESNPRWKGGKKEFTCDWCGKKFEKHPSTRKNYEYNFCGNDCRHKHYAKRIVGENNPRFKEKIKVQCDFCGVSFSILPCFDRLYAKHFCNPSCRGKWNEVNYTTHNNPNWKGGTSFEPYPITFTFPLREAIRNRDDRKCRVCGIEEKVNRERLAVHHVDYDKKNNAHENLVALCHLCHCKTNSKRSFWQSFFAEQTEL